MNARTPFTIALLTAGFAHAQGAVLLDNWGTSTSDTAVASFQTPHLRLIRFTTPSYATQLQSFTVRMATSSVAITNLICEVRTGVTTNAGTVVHTMTCPTLLWGTVRTYTFTTSGFTFQPSTTYGISIRGNTGTDSSGSWYRGDPIVQPTGLATWLNTRITYNGTTFNTDALIPRFTLNVADLTQTLTGNVTFSDTVGTFAANRTMNYSIVQGTTTIQTGTIVSSSSSQAFNISLPASATGTAVFAVDGSSFLRESRGITLTGTTTNIGPTNVRNGDPDLSGEVDAADIDMVIADFGSMSIGNTDVDVSGEVDATDIDIVISNFGNTDE